MSAPDPRAAKRLLVISEPADWIPGADPEAFPWPLMVQRVASLADAALLAEPAAWDVVAFRVATVGPSSPAEILTALRDLAPEATFLPVAARPDPREAIVYLKHGAFEYLEEPLPATDFLRALGEAIENRETFREILELNRALEEQKQQLLAEKRELERRNRELEAVSYLARALSSTLDLPEILRHLTRCVRESLGFQRIMVGLFDVATAREETKTALGPGGELAEDALRELQWSLAEERSNPWLGTVLRAGQVLVVEDPASHPQTRGTALAKIHQHPFVKIPMTTQGRVLGTLTVESASRERLPTPEEISLLGIFADTAAMAVENARLYHSVRELSVTDELTGLFNRRHLLRQLDAECNHAERHLMPLSLLMVDIDHFKQLNDGNDHLVGDAALCKLSRILQRNVRGIDTAARYGGEEFVVLLPRTPREGALIVAEKLRKLVEKTSFQGEGVVPGGALTASVGVAVYPGDADSPRQLLECADWALYQAKERGRNRVYYWQAEDRAQAG